MKSFPPKINPKTGAHLKACACILCHREWKSRALAAESARESAEARGMARAIKELRSRVAFLRLWTAKEASCKSTGTGIYGQLDRWVFDVAEEAPRLLALPVEAGSAMRWHHLRVAPAPGDTAVLACDGWVPRARSFELHEA